MRESGNRDIGKIESKIFTTETRRHGENKEIQMMIPTSDLTSSNSSLCSFVFFVVNRFTGDFQSIGVCS